MSSSASDATQLPDIVLIGHAAKDVAPDGAWRLGGTVSYAALTAQRLGLRVGVVTSGPPDLLAALGALSPGISIVAVPAAEATTFENRYADGARRQFLRSQAAPLGLAHVPDSWRAARLVLLAPLAHEVAVSLAAAFPFAHVAATPQGWLRRWQADGAVTPGALDVAPALLPYLDSLIVSAEDLAVPGTPDANELAAAQVARWAASAPLVVMTLGAAGARLTVDGGAPQAFPGYPAREVDPTGAGDVFAGAYLARLQATGDPHAAVDFANRVAALSVERDGISGIPTVADLLARYPDIQGL